jgi:hypothetical protein
MWAYMGPLLDLLNFPRVLSRLRNFFETILRLQTCGHVWALTNLFKIIFKTKRCPKGVLASPNDF